MPVTAVVTGAPDPLGPAPRLPLPDAEAVPDFLAAHQVSAVLWAAAPLDPVRLDVASARPVVILPMPDPAGAIPGGRLRRRAAAEVLARCRVLVPRAADARGLRRVTRGTLELTTIGNLQDGVAIPPHDETRRARIAASLAGRPVWFAVAAPPELRGAVMAAHDALIARVHRALLILEADDGAPSPSGLPDKQENVLTVTDPDERGLWHRIAPVTLMADTFAPGGRADPLVPAALGSAILYGPEQTPQAESYARLTRVGAARQVPEAGAIAAAVEELLMPSAAANQAGAAWAEVTRGAEATDRAAEAVIDALERAGAL